MDNPVLHSGVATTAQLEKSSKCLDLNDSAAGSMGGASAYHDYRRRVEKLDGRCVRVLTPMLGERWAMRPFTDLFGE